MGATRPAARATLLLLAKCVNDNWWRGPGQRASRNDRRPRVAGAGTSVGMIEAHYGDLIDTARDAILTRLEAIG